MTGPVQYDSSMKFRIHTDGGARGNPGPAGIGIVIEKEEGNAHTIISSYGKHIGIATNNVAEYSAVKDALETLVSKDLKGEGNVYAFFLDSLLVVNQLNGSFKVKDATLRDFLSRIRILEQQLGGITTYTHIPRVQNSRADAEVNKALDIFLYQ
jgi:ribonuclease HI